MATPTTADLLSASILLADPIYTTILPLEPNLNVSAFFGTPLYAAVKARKHHFVKYLLDNGMDPDDDQYRPLEAAIQNKDVEMVKLIMDPQYRHPRGTVKFQMAISEAARVGDHDLVRLLLEYADLPNLAIAYQEGLRWAALRNYKQVASYLVRQGADVASMCFLDGESLICCPWTMSPLMIVAWRGYVEILRLFLEETRKGQGWSRSMADCLRAAITGDQPESIKVILEFADDIVNLDELSRLLVEGVDLKSNRAVCHLIEGLNVLGYAGIFQVEDACTLGPVMYQACYNGNVGVVKALLTAGFPTNTLLSSEDLDESGELNTPMLAALGSRAEGSKEVVQILRDWGAPDVDIYTISLADLFKTGILPKAPAEIISHRPWVNITVAKPRQYV